MSLLVCLQVSPLFFQSALHKRSSHKKFRAENVFSFVFPFSDILTLKVIISGANSSY